MSKEEFANIVRIGFCQPSFYKPAVWKKSKKIMDELCDLGLVYPFDYGRGKGKYGSDLTIEKVIESGYKNLYF